MALSAGWRAWFRLPPREDAMQAKERTGRESTCGGVDRVAWVLFFSPFLFSFFFSFLSFLFFSFVCVASNTGISCLCTNK